MSVSSPPSTCISGVWRRAAPPTLDKGSAKESPRAARGSHIRTHSRSLPAALQRLTCGPAAAAAGAGGPSTVDVRRPMHFTELAPSRALSTTSLQSTSPLRPPCPWLSVRDRREAAPKSQTLSNSVIQLVKASLPYLKLFSIFTHSLIQGPQHPSSKYILSVLVRRITLGRWNKSKQNHYPNS